MNLNEIKQLVELKTGYNISQESRERELVYCRAIYFKLCRKHTLYTLKKIGKTLNKDHATVLHGIKLLDHTIKTFEPLYYKTYLKLNNIIRRRNGTTEKDIDPTMYYRNKYASTLIKYRRLLNKTKLHNKMFNV